MSRKDDLRISSTYPRRLSPRLLSGNEVDGHAWATWQVEDGWQVKLGLRKLNSDLVFEAGLSELLLHARHLEFPSPFGEFIPRRGNIAREWLP